MKGLKNASFSHSYLFYELNYLHVRVLSCVLSCLQWNPVNPVTNGPQNSSRINGVAVLKRFFE